MVASTGPEPLSSVTEIAEVKRVSKSYVSRLALFAPDLVEAILGGWADQQVMLEKLERALPVGWEEQRRSSKYPSGQSRALHRPWRVPGAFTSLAHGGTIDGPEGAHRRDR